MALWEDAFPRGVTLRQQLNKGVFSAPCPHNCLPEIVPALCHPLGRAGTSLPCEPQRGFGSAWVVLAAPVCPGHSFHSFPVHTAEICFVIGFYCRQSRELLNLHSIIQPPAPPASSYLWLFAGSFPLEGCAYSLAATLLE